MYERFTDRARRAVQLATREAARRGHEYVSVESLIAGLIEEGSGIAAHVLAALGIHLADFRAVCARMIPDGVGDATPVERLPHTPRFKEVIASAIDEARTLGCEWVGGEHLLLGLLRNPETPGVQALVELGASPDVLRHEVLLLLGKTPAGGVDAKYGDVTTTLKSFYPGEPVFILRAQDNLAGVTLLMYEEACKLGGCIPAHIEAIQAVRAAFRAWQEQHPDLTKNPD